MSAIVREVVSAAEFLKAEADFKARLLSADRPTGTELRDPVADALAVIAEAVAYLAKSHNI